MMNSTIKKYNRFFCLVASRRISPKLYLRRSVQQYIFIATGFIFSFGLASCEKNFDIQLDNYKPLLVVEAYINNEMPDYNYVVLSRSLEYFSTDFQSQAVVNANVSITEGEYINNQYVWNGNSRVQLAEANLPGIPENFRQGVYFDPRLITDRPNALIGKPGKSYLLQISEGENQYSSITTLLTPVLIDSVTAGESFIDETDSNRTKLRITNHYKDPDTLNNTQFFYYRFAENRNNFGWGGLFRSRASISDELTNGEYMRLTQPRNFIAGDTVHYSMASVTRDVFNFWDSSPKPVITEDLLQHPWY